MPAPDHDDDFWKELADRPWRRVKWRQVDDIEGRTCAAYDRPLHRSGTYYLRPAYTDGEIWLCQQAYDEMTRRTKAQRATRSYRTDESRE